MPKQNPKTLEEAFSLITKDMLKTFIKKHQDYGKGNILSLKELGIAYRESEKIERIKNLLQKSSKPKNESLKDNWEDIAVYAVIAIMYHQSWFQDLELEKSS